MCLSLDYTAARETAMEKTADQALDKADLAAGDVPVVHRTTEFTDNIVPHDMSSGSHSARPAFSDVVAGKLVEVGAAPDQAASTIVESDNEEAEEKDEETQEENESQITGNKREREESLDDDEQPFVYKYKCGRIPEGICYAQCDCLVCLGCLDSDSDDEADE